jgi:hypothetical protein
MEVEADADGSTDLRRRIGRCGGQDRRPIGHNPIRFTRQALRQALAQERERALERKHREGYLRKPVRRGEFSGWETEHAWGEP